MSKFLKVFCLLLVTFLIVSLCACDSKDENVSDTYLDSENLQLEENELTEEKVVSTGWQCTYYTGTDKIYTRFILADDGTYTQLIAINELFDHTEKGTYEVKNGKLYLYRDGDINIGTVYEYKNENFFNSGNEYTPYAE